MARARWKLIVPCCLVIVLVAVMAWRMSRKPKTTPAQPTSVETLVVVAKAVPEFIDAAGTFVSPQPVQVMPQTGGVLESVHIRDGQEVRKGQLLFTIDPRPLRAELAQAEATLARDQALAADAIDSERRERALAAQDSTSRKSYITARNTARSLQAAVASDRAQVTAARLSLDYTRIRAPISGRAGIILMQPGNMVSTASTTPLVVINALSSLQISFALPRPHVDSVLKAIDARGTPSLPVLVLHPVTGKTIARGHLLAMNNSYDDTSGTLGMRALFENADERHLPGEFATVRIVLSDGEGVLAIPESALQQGQNGPYAFCVVDGHAKVRQLGVARIVDGWAVIDRGLQAGDRVITAVPSELRDEDPVQLAPDTREAQRKTANHGDEGPTTPSAATGG